MLLKRFAQLSLSKTGDLLIHRWQPLALVAAIGLTAGAGAATAQTVIVKGAPSGTEVELVVNGMTVAMATSNAESLATLAVSQAAAATKEVDVRVFVDRCGELRRVLLVENPREPPGAEGTCVRQTTPGVFVMRRRTTFVVEVAGANPVVWLTQGRPPASWLLSGPNASAGGSAWGPSPTGFVLFGGGGVAMFGNVKAVACGNVSSCTVEKPFRSYAAGAAYWFTPFAAAEAQFVDRANAKVQGTDTNLQFNSSLETRLLTMAGVVAAPLGRVRLYGRAGMNRHRATLRTTQTISDTSVTTDAGTQTIAGGTQTLEIRTAGWGYLFGGGGEVWLSERVAIYGDLNRVKIKGNDADLPEGSIDDKAWLIHAGVRVRIGR
jgi:hypothetical protein